MFTSTFLTSFKRRALRRGVWFRVLDGLERGILSLAASVVDKVESSILGVELMKILGKLRDAMSSGFSRLMRENGYARARKIAFQAVSWGFDAAREWADDLGFVRYVTLIDYNAPSGWGP